MKLTNPEKLILNMLANLNEKCGIDTEQAKLVNRAIVTGNTWALSYAPEFGHIYGDEPEPLPVEVREVLDILAMWTTIENSLYRISMQERDALEADHAQLRFDGFDGNHEAEAMGIAEFAVRTLGKFAWFKDRSMNAHMTRLPNYVRMLRLYTPIYKTMDDAFMTADQLRTVLLKS